MKGLTRSQLHQIKEAFDLASFSKKWWKQLSKEIKKSGISNFQKIQVYMKIVVGLVHESQSCFEELDDMAFVLSELDQLCNSIHWEGE